MSHTAPAGRPKAAQSAARAQPLSADPTARSAFAILGCVFSAFCNGLRRPALEGGEERDDGEERDGHSDGDDSKGKDGERTWKEWEGKGRTI